jgi:hypothetical protein
VWEESDFDSDQAIVGLMAKHIAEGRALPLFFYGQEYMLAVESWVMAPVFLLFGPDVFAMHFTTALINLATGLLLWHLLVRDAGLGRWTAALAALPFWLAPFVLSAFLIESHGGNIEPFFWVLALWALRLRPMALGAAAAVAVLNREFSAYAVPALVSIALWEWWRQRRREDAGPARAGARRLCPGDAIGRVARPWLVTTFAFLAVFGGLRALQPLADLMGPGSAGQAVSGMARVDPAFLAERLGVDVAALPARLRTLVTGYVPTMLGLSAYEPRHLAIGTDLWVGWDELRALVALVTVVLCAWLLLNMRHARQRSGAPFPAFLMLVGLQAGVVYAMAYPPDMQTFRYGLLVVYLPIGIWALALQGHRPQPVRLMAALGLTLVATAAAIDHARVIERSYRQPPPVRFAEVARVMDARGITIARSGYWRAYAVAFLTEERVKVASTEVKRIQEYEDLADRATGGVVSLQDWPCEPGRPAERVGGFYLCWPRQP